jgi:putative ABC transport system permease protein
MILKYVLKNFSRRLVRTVLMVLSLAVSTGLIVAMSATVATVRQSNVDLIASETGRYDLAVTRRDTSPDPFIAIDETAAAVLAADPRLTAVYPRFEALVELAAGERIEEGYLLALDPATDAVGAVTVVEGEYAPGGGNVAMLEGTANTLDVDVGDTVDVAYSFPLPRETGRPATTGASERRLTRRFTVTGIVRQDGVAGGDVRRGVIAALDETQEWLGLPGRAGMLVATVDPALYETNNAEVAALRMRDVTRNVAAALGDEYSYSMAKAAVLGDAAQAFLAVQAIINVYGLISLGVVGLLVYTLVMTNVQEQRRDMAVLRILGAQRNFLFSLVIAEVLVIGLIGVTLGVIVGQLITTYVVAPIMESQFAAIDGINVTLSPRLSLGAVLPPALSAFIVLLISSIRPAQEAARTKVMHAINPGVADNIQLEDLVHLRERRPDFRMFLIGVALILIFGLIAGFQALSNFGGPAIQVTIILLSLALLVLGLGLMFFIVTVPMERLTLAIVGAISPRLTYFARRNVGRGRLRNTLISLLVLFSGVLPSFLATQTALENASFERTIRHDMGAPILLRSAWWVDDPESSRVAPAFRTETLAAAPGVDRSAALTYGYQSRAADTVNFRGAPVTVYGVDGRLGEVLFPENVEFVAGGPAAFDEILADPAAIIISEGLAAHLAVGLGDRIDLTGEGTDHQARLRVAAIARRLPGMDDIGRSRVQAQSNSGVLVSLDAFRTLITKLDETPPPPDKPLMERVLATTAPGADQNAMNEEMGRLLGQDYNLWLRFVDVELEENRQESRIQQVMLLTLTLISFTTAVFGVFAVIYVSIYARRVEIGMMKAIGMKRRELSGMLIVEAIAMTLGAALAGILAGALMGYISFYSDRIFSQRPTVFAVDTTVVPFIVVMVVLASTLGAAFSARRIVRMRAVEILRME